MNNATESATDSIARLISWCSSIALPFWGEFGFDYQTSSFHERLDFSANPILSVPQRTLVQGRQIYAFAQAAQLGWFPEGADLAICAAETMIRRHWRPDGRPGWVFSITGDGNVADATRDTYSHAFALYGLAWAYSLQRNPQYLEIADQTLEFVDQHLTSDKFGGLLDSDRADVRTIRQNPHMHMLEAALAWHEMTGESRFIARAKDIVDLFCDRLFQSGSSVLVEYFNEDWHPVTSCNRFVFEPGHHFEWVWLLHQYSQKTGRTVDDFTQALFSKAVDYGISDFLVVDKVHDDGEISDSSTRVWPQTEALKAFAVEHSRGRLSMVARATELMVALERRFIGRPFPAGWIDHFHPDGKPKVDFVPASTLYHIVLGLAEADRVFNERSNLRFSTR